MRITRLMTLCVALLVSSVVRAELTIEITKGVDNPVPVAIVPFSWTATSKLPADIAEIVESDLRTSGQFSPMNRNDMLSQPDSSKDVHYRDWRALGMDYVLVGRLMPEGADRIAAKYELLDVNGKQKILGGTFSDKAENIRTIAHAISDAVYEKLTGIKGAFSTRLLYVSAKRTGKDFRYRLLTSDIDGARERVLLDQDQPIMTPAWAPDGETIAYVSFETTRPAIYMHNIITGERRQLTNFRGINGAPAWSPDGKRLALVLSKDGNPDVYILNVETLALRRVTRHFAIDTEPAWMPDGESIVFTSDRGGRPQIYRLELDTKRIERLTFEGNYNARSRVLPDGRGIVMVHRSGGNYHIAVQDFQRRTFSILTETALDESPSIAPNGTMILYATMRGNQGVLAAVSLDGTISYALPSQYGDVREPAWSPYLR